MANKGQKKWWRCAHYEFEYDDWGKYCWCHSRDCPHKECEAKNIFQMSVCPYYKRGKEAFFLKQEKWHSESMREFKERMEKEKMEIELKERALLKHLKEKYES